MGLPDEVPVSPFFVGEGEERMGVSKFCTKIFFKVGLRFVSFS